MKLTVDDIGRWYKSPDEVDTILIAFTLSVEGNIWLTFENVDTQAQTFLELEEFEKYPWPEIQET